MTPERFEFRISECFRIEGRGTVVTGRYTRGAVTVGDMVELWRDGERVQELPVRGIEMIGGRPLDADPAEGGLLIESELVDRQTVGVHEWVLRGVE
jgi:translation elongation factor EF-Tu-like GTPase